MCFEQHAKEDKFLQNTIKVPAKSKGRRRIFVLFCEWMKWTIPYSKRTKLSVYMRWVLIEQMALIKPQKSGPYVCIKHILWPNSYLLYNYRYIRIVCRLDDIWKYAILLYQYTIIISFVKVVYKYTNVLYNSLNE